MTREPARTGERPRRRPAHIVAMQKRSRAYRQLWRVVDGAVFDAFDCHPDYLTDKGRYAARISIVKRVTGAVLGFAEQSAEGRSEAISAAERGDSAWEAPPRTMRKSVVSKGRAVWLGIARLLSWRRS